jgi:hypothetical protein
MRRGNNVMSIILNRIKEIDFFPISILSFISDEDVSLYCQKIEDRNEEFEFVHEIDISLFGKSEIQSFLQTLPFKNESIIALWFFESFGVQMPRDIFYKYFDELWYPSSDDIWVFDLQEEYYLEISHEEKIILYKKCVC